MAKEKIRYNQKYIARMVCSLVVYVIIWLVIQARVFEDYGYMAQHSLVEQSLKDYLSGIMCCLAAALTVNGFWWWLALNKGNIRQSFEKNTIIYAMILAVFVFVIILTVNSAHGGIVDDLGHECALPYAYSIGTGFLINVFGVPPQTVQDVLLPGGLWGRVLVVIVALGITVGILI